MIYRSMGKPKESYNKFQQTGVSFLGGYIAGIFCAIVSHPADVMVSKLNAERKGRFCCSSESNYANSGSWRTRDEGGIPDLWEHWIHGAVEWSRGPNCYDRHADWSAMATVSHILPWLLALLTGVAMIRSRCSWVCRQPVVIRVLHME